MQFTNACTIAPRELKEKGKYTEDCPRSLANASATAGLSNRNDPYSAMK
jgi:hypothetical protein